MQEQPTHPTARQRLTRRLGILVSVVLALTGFGLTTAGPASATHYRATQVTWTRTAADTASFEVTAAWRCTFYFNPCTAAPGDTFFSDALSYGDGQSDVPEFTVLSVDAVNDVITAEAEVSHTYASPGPWVASITACCRLSGPQHINNPDGSVRIESVVDLARTSASPVSAISPIVDCAVDALCRFTVPATDADGQGLRFRLATSAESGLLEQPGPSSAPNAASINATTGVYSWDTTGATLNPGGNSFYSTQVVVENVVGGTVVSRTPVDFFIRLASGGTNRAPVFTAPTPADGTVLTASVGSSVTFSVAATDPDTADTVSLSMIGKPAAATYTTTSGNPATGTFSWTPTAVGSAILVLNATDQLGLSATQRSVTVNVVQPTGATLSIGDATQREGDGPGNRLLKFTVTLSAAQAGPVTVKFATAPGTALAGSDFVAKSGTLTFPAGTTSLPLNVKVVGDTVVERKETLTVKLSRPSAGVALLKAVGTGKIMDDDGPSTS